MPIPGEPHDRTADELTTSDGRKVKLKIPGFEPLKGKPFKTEERGADEPPREDPRPPGVNPNHAGL